jgi:hypothetical protein
MLRVDRTKKSLALLEKRSLRDAGIWERRDLQQMIRNAPAAFCDEMGESMRFVGEEVAPSDEVQDRIDLLAIDGDGDAVILEIKRDSHKLHLLQALSYAAMVAQWPPKRFVDELAKYNGRGQTVEQAREELEEALLEEDLDAANRSQRIILLAEDFHFEVLVTAKWLTERHDIDIRCYRLALATHGNEEFLTCTRVYPPPELTEIAIKQRRKRDVGTVEPTNWDQALAGIENDAVAKFFRQQIERKRPNNPRARVVQFYVGNRRRFTVYAKPEWGRVSQQGRFEDDVQFWKERLSDEDITPISDGRKLRFYLHNEADFSKFKSAAETELTNTQFSAAPESEAEDADEAAE